MNHGSKLRQIWCQLKLNPFFAPEVTGFVVLTALLPWIGISLWYGFVLLWAVLWATLEHMAKREWPRSRVRLLTPNFFAVKDLAGVWRIFQRVPTRLVSCRQMAKELLEDQRRLSEALTPGRYYTLTHETILSRLRGMDKVNVTFCREAYVATMEDTVLRIMRGHCKHCTEQCPFLGRSKSSTFYEVRFEIR